MRIAALARKAGAASTVAIGAGALVVGAALPGHAADEAEGGAATAAALEAEVAGKAISEELEAVWNGSKQVTNGVPTPDLPDLVTGGVLSQDAIGNAYFSAACSGLVGAGGKVSLDAEGTCIADGGGKVAVSLGTLPQLGVEDLLSQLPDVPDVPDLGNVLDGLPLPELSGKLPDANLRIVGEAITARCAAEPAGAQGLTTAANLQLVADVDGQVVVLGNITKQDGLTLSHTELLNKVSEVLPADAQQAIGDVVAKLEQLPTDQLTDQLPQLTELVSIQTDVQQQTEAGIEVTALEASVAAPATPGVMDGLPTDALTEALGDKLDGITGKLGDLTGTLTGDQLYDADLGPASVRIGHVSCAAPVAAGSGSDSGGTVDVETEDAQDDARSQRGPNERQLDDLDLDSVTAELEEVIATLESLGNL